MKILCNLFQVKLADVLGKKIIPVNFMDNWPPACLAIQFASTQYIPWKLQDSEHGNFDIFQNIIIKISILIVTVIHGLP